VRLGLSPARGVDAARKLGERLADKLRDPIEREVRPVVYADYHALVDCLVRGEVDIAWMPPLPFLDAADRGAGSLAMAMRHGRTSYEAAIVVRADSALRELADLRGRTAAWVDRDSASGFMFPQVELLRELGSPRTVLARESFLGSHRAVCEAVANGWADAGATYAVRDESGAVRSAGWIEALGERAGELRPIRFIGPIPADNIAHRPHLPSELARQLTQALLDLRLDAGGRALLREVFGADEMVTADLRLYDEMRRALAVGQPGR
jgi:phosphonate transport system substrate-binding protein